MAEFSICETPDVLRVIYFIKILINIVKILIPIILIIFVSFNCAKGVVNGEIKFGDSLKENVNKIISAILIFAIPTIVNFVLEVLDENTDYESCWVNAESEKIEELQVLWDAAEEEKRREEEEKRQEELENNKEEVEYDESTDSGTHINSINKIKYNLYNQSDSAWGDKVYTNGKDTISNNGCMITSVAVVSSAYNSDITPVTVFNPTYRHQWAYISVNSLTDGSFSCIKNNSMSKNEIIQNLKDGNVVIIMVKAASNFTDSQHYMALIDIRQDGSQIFVGNSYGSGKGTYNRSGWFDTDVVLYDVREVNVCLPSDELLEEHSDNKIPSSDNGSGSNNGGTSGGNGSNNGNNSSNNNGSNSGDITYGKLTYQYINDGTTMPYALYTPTNKSSSTPLIIWLHGLGEVGVGYATFKNSGMLAVLNNWNLAGFNAYVLCPHLSGSWNTSNWQNEKTRTNLYKLIDKIIAEKNINKNKVILIGHSLGGTGVLYMAYGKTNYYSALVVLSGYNPNVANLSSLKEIPIKGYAENYGDTYNFMNGIFAPTFGSDKLTLYSGAFHGAVPRLALTEDKNGDGRSDLIVWMLAQNKKVRRKNNIQSTYD